MKKKSQVFFSIIIPHKNTPNLLTRCVNSIPNDKSIEIIIVDDNSDLSLKNFDDISDYVNVNILLTKEGKGAGFARNQGLKVAKGKWIIFADSDDFFSDDFFSIINTYKDCKEDVIFFNVKSVYSDNILKEAERHIAKNNLFEKNYKNPDIGDHLFRYNYPEPWGKMIKRDLIISNNILFDETFICNDYLFSVKVGYFAKQIRIVNNILYVVTLRNDSLSNKTIENFSKLLGRIYSTTNVYHFIQEKQIPIGKNPLRGLMVIVLKKYPLQFIPVLIKLKKKGVLLMPLIKQIFNYRFFSK